MDKSLIMYYNVYIMRLFVCQNMRIKDDTMKYLRRELHQVEKEYLKQFGENSLDRVILHDPNTKDKQEVQDTIDILKEAIAKNKPLEQVPEDMWKLIEF